MQQNSYCTADQTGLSVQFGYLCKIFLSDNNQALQFLSAVVFRIAAYDIRKKDSDVISIPKLFSVIHR